MIIRAATADDVALLARIGEETFRAAFASYNSPDNLESYIEKAYSEAAVAKHLFAEQMIYRIAEDEGAAVAFARYDLKHQPPHLEGKATIELCQIYVLTSEIGKGIGGKLLEDGFELGRTNDKNIIWLGVWENNPKAIRFYERWGFQTTSSHTFMLGDEAQRDLIMERAI